MSGHRGSWLKRNRWHAKLEEIAIECCAASAASTSATLGTFLDVLANAPEGAALEGLNPAQVSAEPIDQSVHDCTAICLGLLGQEAGYMLSCGQQRLHVASVILPQANHETTASGTTLALALIGAICLALVDRDRDRFLSTAGGITRRSVTGDRATDLS